MPQHYDTASRMLGVTENKILGPADKLLRKVAESAGVGDTFYRTSVAIFQAPEGVAGRSHHARSLLRRRGPGAHHLPGLRRLHDGMSPRRKKHPRHELPVPRGEARREGFPETRVVDVQPLDGMPMAALGIEFRREKSTAFAAAPSAAASLVVAVVFAASALGTMELLFRLKDKRSLPHLSNQVGRYVRTNSESLIGVRVPGTTDDLSKGVAIGSGIYIDEHTHIEAVRYPNGSDSMSAWTTILTGGRPGPDRIGLWLKNLLVIRILHPIRTFRIMQPFGWARESVILLCMQALDGHIDMCWERSVFSPFRKTPGQPRATHSDLHSRRPMSSPSILPPWPEARP